MYQTETPVIAIIKLGDSTALLNMVHHTSIEAKNSNLNCGFSYCLYRIYLTQNKITAVPCILYLPASLNVKRNKDANNCIAEKSPSFIECRLRIVLNHPLYCSINS